MERVEIASLYKATPADGTKVTVCGWAKTVRDSKKIGFISLADGSCYKPVQIVFQADKLENYAEVAKSGLYTSFEVTGTLVLTPNAKQPFEINADTVTVLGTCGSDYPLQKSGMYNGRWQLGTGHGMWSHDEDGNLIYVFHNAEYENGRYGGRDAQVRRVHWSKEGMPILDMQTAEELDPDYARVTMEVGREGDWAR